MDPIIDTEFYQQAETAAVVADLAHKATKAVPLTDGGLYAVLDADGAVRMIETPGFTDRRGDDRADRPRTVCRKVTLLDVDSFLDYLGRYSADDMAQGDYRSGAGSLEVWADIDGRKVTAVLDGVDGWLRHTATLQLALSREWAEWAAVDGKLFPQAEFAQFIEDHLSTIGEPAGALLLDVCQTLEATKQAQFKSQQILANGQRQFVYEEQLEARAGQKGNLSIPTELTLVLRPFQGSEPMAVLARFRYRLNEGNLRLGVKLAEPERALERAFDLVVDAVQSGVPVRVNHGRL